MLTLYKNIKKCREELGLTKVELANRIGYERSMITKVEQGKVDLTQSKIFAFAIALETSPAHLMGHDVENVTSPHEQSILAAYRTQPETQHAIDYILEKPEHCKFVNQYALLDERDQDRITERMETLLEDEKYSPKAKASLA